MKQILLPAIALAMMVMANASEAEERTVMLKLDNFGCASCAFIIQNTLASIPGVTDCKVSYRQKTASVTYDDAKADVAALTAATADLGFPSRLVQR
jgi:mercuric ion binding protein